MGRAKEEGQGEEEEWEEGRPSGKKSRGQGAEWDVPACLNTVGERKTSLPEFKVKNFPLKHLESLAHSSKWNIKNGPNEGAGLSGGPQASVCMCVGVRYKSAVHVITQTIKSSLWRVIRTLSLPEDFNFIV